MKPNDRVTPADLEAGIAAAENEGVLNPTASQVLAIHRAMLAADQGPDVEALLRKAERVVQAYTIANPRWQRTGGNLQDPSGAHKLLEEIRAALGDG